MSTGIGAWGAVAFSLLGVVASGCSRVTPSVTPTLNDGGDGTPTRVDAAVILSKEQRAQRALDSSCAICHSLDLVRTQRLTRAQWDKELKKMSGWGAPLSDEDAIVLLDVLSAERSIDAAALPEVWMPAVEVAESVAPDVGGLSAGDVVRGQALYRATCFACHGTAGEGVHALGPALVARPVLYRRREFADVVTRGRKRMPAFDRVYDARAIGDLRAFLETLR